MKELMPESSNGLPKRYGVRGHAIYIESSAEIIGGTRTIVRWETISLQEAFIKETTNLLRRNTRQREDDACQGLGIKDTRNGD